MLGTLFCRIRTSVRALRPCADCAAQRVSTPWMGKIGRAICDRHEFDEVYHVPLPALPTTLLPAFTHFHSLALAILSFHVLLSNTTLIVYFKILAFLGLFALSNAAPAGVVQSSPSPTTDSGLAVYTEQPTQEHPPLLPAVHWEHVGDDYGHLAPQSEHALYFSSHGLSDPRVEHAFAHFNATWQKAVVIADHSDHVRSVGCAAGGVAIQFTNKEAYQYAKKTWPSNDDFMLVRTENACYPCAFGLTCCRQHITTGVANHIGERRERARDGICSRRR